MFAAVIALSQQHERAISPAVVYLVLGAAAAGIVRALGVDWLDPIEDAALIERLAEFAVIVALFGAGLKLDRPLHWREWSSTARMILIVMPLTIGAIAAFGAGAMEPEPQFALTSEAGVNDGFAFPFVFLGATPESSRCYYAAAIIDGRVLAETEAIKVFWTVVVLAGFSIVAHGLTATSLGRRVERAGPARSGAAR